MAEIKLNKNKTIGDYLNPYIVAELNTSHFGDLAIAKEMIEKAKECGCDCVKLQSWSSDSLYSKKFYEENKMAKRFFDKFSLASDQILELSKFSESIEIDITSTPYSIEEAEFLVNEINVPFIKIASMEINNYRYLSQLGNLQKPLVLSTGMSTIQEIENAVKIIEKTNNEKIIILHCVSIYPSIPEIINLQNIVGLRNSFPNYPIGFSDHTIGTNIPTSSVALGAALIEKHFTLNNEKIGFDNQMATEPEEMKNMVESCKKVYLSMGSEKRELSNEELTQRIKMRRSLISQRSLKKGHIITEKDILIKRPGDGIPPNDLEKIIGSKLLDDMDEETQFLWEKLDTNYKEN